MRGHTLNGVAPTVAATITIVLVLGARPGVAQTGTDHVLEHDGRERSYRVFAPSTLDDSRPAPVVIALHGGGGNAAREEGRVRYNEFAQRDGWIVAYPNAVEGHWNDLRGFDGFTSHRENVDDIGFIERLLDDLAVEFAVDEDRVYLTGGSNGGMMTHAVANELADRIAAIAPIVGAMPRPVYERFNPSRALSAVFINDRGDPAVLWEGGAGGRANFVSVPATVERWRGVNGCADNDTTSAEALSDEPDDVRVTKTVWNRCAPGVTMVLYAVEANRHGHPTALLDKEGRRRVYEVIWDFFVASSR